MVEQKKIKVCFRENLGVTEKELEHISLFFRKKGNRVISQVIDNGIHGKWLADQNTMQWKYIIDIDGTYTLKEIMDQITELLQMNLQKIAVDMYQVREYTYQKPLKEAEMITSCYLWNEEASETERMRYMMEHFEMEKQQVKYDYVAFQLVEEKYDRSSPRYDFFFESHISDKDGIDYIYEKPALQVMREHSQHFLNTDTRRLSFGHVQTWEE